MTDFDKEISEGYELLAVKRKELQLARQRFILLAETFISESFLTTTAELVKRHAEYTLQRGKETLSQLKREVRKLQKKGGALASDLLDQEENWWNGSLSDTSDIHLSGQPKKLDQAMRMAMGAVGPLLDQHGYLTIDDWQPDLPPGPEREYCLPPPVVWSAPLLACLQEYRAAVLASRTLLASLDRLHQQKKAHQVAELWDNA